MAEKRIGLVCFGRGIERDQNGVWQPTAYLERMTPDHEHCGTRAEGLRLTSDDENVVIAGAYANATATAYLFASLSPKLLAWAAGRPKYIEQEPPDLSEGSVLFNCFKKKFKGMETQINKARIDFQTENKNTYDDLTQSLAAAREMKLDQLTIVSVFLHLRRIAEFHRCVLRENPDFKNVSVDFVASESILMYLGNVSKLLLLDDPEATGELNDLTLMRIVESKVFRRTVARENQGIADLRAGRYNLGKQGYQFAAT